MNDEGRITPDEMLLMLDELADEIPEKLFEKLNMGVMLLNETHTDPISVPEHPLFILGRYIRDWTGRRIEIYYGSIMRVYGYLEAEAMKDVLRGVLRHELRHHLENLGGERDLEWEDLFRLIEYRSEYVDGRK